MLRKQQARIQPIKQHHIADFGVKSERNSTQVSGKTNDVPLYSNK